MAGRREHEIPDRSDEPAFLGDPDEIERGNQAARRMTPAHERFDAGRMHRAFASIVRAQAHDRLVDDEQLALRERSAQVDLDAAAARGALLHVRLEYHVAAAAGALGLDHRDAGLLHDAIAVADRLGAQHDADADAAMNLVRADAVRLQQFVEQALCDRVYVVGPAQVIYQDHEFVAADAGRHEMFGAPGTKPSCARSAERRRSAIRFSISSPTA
jgi:hypothetical protein